MVASAWVEVGTGMAKSKRLKWADSPAGHDYPAATSYLSLMASPALADVLSSFLGAVGSRRASGEGHSASSAASAAAS